MTLTDDRPKLGGVAGWGVGVEPASGAEQASCVC